MSDFDDDALDGVLFRFWIHGASNFPGAVAMAIVHCTTPASYREALMKLATVKCINLPSPP